MIFWTDCITNLGWECVREILVHLQIWVNFLSAYFRLYGRKFGQLILQYVLYKVRFGTRALLTSHADKQRWLIYTEDMPLGHLCKMCDPFSYEFRVILSANVFQSPYLYTFMEPRNRFQRIHSASLCSLRAGRTNRVVEPAQQARNRFLGSWKKGLQIRALLVCYIANFFTTEAVD